MNQVLVSKDYQNAVKQAYKNLPKDTTTWTKNDYINSCMKMVVDMACKYAHCSNANVDELICEGNLGVCHAWTKYKPEKGAKFSSYAYMWARARMLNYLKKEQKYSERHGSLDEYQEDVGETVDGDTGDW